MTTKAKGITLPDASPYTNILGTSLKVTSVVNDYTVSNAWQYGPANLGPINPIPVMAAAPVNFTISGQSSSGSFAAIGGNITLTPGAGSVGNSAGNVIITGGAWNTSHLVLGIFHLWIDSTGALRIKSSAPTSSTDGALV